MKRLAALLPVLLLLFGAACAGRGTPLTAPSIPTPGVSPRTPSPSPAPSPVPSSPASSPRTPAPSPTAAPSPPATPRPKPPPTTPAPSSSLPSSLVGTEWTTLPTSQKVVALTFDAGANDAAVASILSTLQANGVPGTFFLTGRWTELYPDDVRDIAARYPVGNHTDSHPYLTTLSDDGVRSEITRAGSLIATAAGKDPRPLFRFPYGDSDARTIGLANSLGYGGIRWTVDTIGWRGTSGGESVDRIVARVIAALQPGEIVLMHVGSNPDDGSTLDADALPRIIAEIRGRGYGFVTVAQYV